MVAEPAATPATVPVVELVPVTVATVVLDELHVELVAGVPLPVKAVVWPTKPVVEPLIVGRAFTVPLTVTVLVVALGDVIETVPEGVPVAVVAIRT